MEHHQLRLAKQLEKQQQSSMRAQYYSRWLTVLYLRSRNRQTKAKRTAVKKNSKILSAVHATPISSPATPPCLAESPVDGTDEKTSSGVLSDKLAQKDTSTLRYALEQQTKMLELRDRLINHLSKMRDDAIAKRDVEADAVVTHLRMKNIALEKRIETLCSCLSLPRETTVPSVIHHVVPPAPAGWKESPVPPATQRQVSTVDTRPTSAKGEVGRRVGSARKKRTTPTVEEPQLFVLKGQGTAPVRPLKIKDASRVAQENELEVSTPTFQTTSTARFLATEKTEARHPAASANSGRTSSFQKTAKSPSLGATGSLPLLVSSSPIPTKKQ